MPLDFFGHADMIVCADMRLLKMRSYTMTCLHKKTAWMQSADTGSVVCEYQIILSASHERDTLLFYEIRHRSFMKCKILHIVAATLQFDGKCVCVIFGATGLHQMVVCEQYSHIGKVSVLQLSCKYSNKSPKME